MGMKLHRNRRVFRDRNPLPRILAWIIGGAAVIALGFFGAKYFTEHPLTPAPESSVAAPQTSTVPTTTPTTKPTATPTVTTDGVRAFYLPLAATRDEAALTATLKAAAAAGFNSVVLDFKDADGNLYFRSENARAAQVDSFTETALSLDDTKALFAAIRQARLQPITRLYAFMDNAAARKLPNARVKHKDYPTYVWYDGDPKKGAKAWLNPYADEAQLYIIELAQELRDCGAAAIMLDGVQFPAQTSGAYFGDTTVPRDEVLTAFVNKARTLLGDKCPVMLSCTAESALGSNTGVYGGNPLTFAPAVASPMLLTGEMGKTVTVGTEKVENTPDNLRAVVKAVVNQMAVRIKVIAADKQPTLTPWLQGYDYTAAQIKTAIDGCIDGGATSFILYNPAGIYDFAALK